MGRTYITMKNILRLIALLAVLVWAAPAQAQNATLNNTTLNGAITSPSASSFVLTSVSPSTGAIAPAAGQCLYVDHELMQITAISSTRVTVIRGTGGTGAGLHQTSAVVFTGACGNFKAADPVASAGLGGSFPSLKACTTATMGVRPWINVLSGNIWTCYNSTWSASNVMVIAYNSITPY